MEAKTGFLRTNKKSGSLRCHLTAILGLSFQLSWKTTWADEETEDTAPNHLLMMRLNIQLQYLKRQTPK